VHPTPFPLATIVTDHGTITGDLITESNGAYVITEQAGSYEEITANQVRTVSVRARATTQKSLWEDITG
jgi:hypothetical protein